MSYSLSKHGGCIFAKIIIQRLWFFFYQVQVVWLYVLKKCFVVKTIHFVLLSFFTHFSFWTCRYISFGFLFTFICLFVFNFIHLKILVHLVKVLKIILIIVSKLLLWTLVNFRKSFFFRLFFNLLTFWFFVTFFEFFITKEVLKLCTCFVTFS